MMLGNVGCQTRKNMKEQTQSWQPFCIVNETTVFCGIILLVGLAGISSFLAVMRRHRRHDSCREQSSSSSSSSTTTPSSSSSLCVGVVGAGAIGTVFGLCLSKHPSIQRPVVLVGRSSGLNKAVDAAHGQITIMNHATATANNNKNQKQTECFQKGRHFIVTCEMKHITECHVILVAVKTPATSVVAAQLANALPLDSTATIVSLQNGLHNAAILRKALQQHAAVQIPSSVDLLAAEWEPNSTLFQLNSVGGGILERPSLSHSTHGRRIATLVQALRQGGLPRSQSTAHIVSKQHTKLLINLINPINALAGVTVPVLLSKRGYRLVWAAAVQEGAQVLQKTSHDDDNNNNKNGGWWYASWQVQLVGWIIPLALRWLPDSFFAWMFATSGVGTNYKSSMLQDLERHRTRTEIDDLSGEIVMRARRDVQVPVNAALVKLVKQAEEARKGSPCLSAQALLTLVGMISNERTNERAIELIPMEKIFQ